MDERCSSLKIISVNMHGFNQGCPAINELIGIYKPDVFLLQEHWLTPANLCRFDIFSEYFTFGCSAMTNRVESGLLVGRPFGDVMIMINNSLRRITRTIHCCDRYAILKVGTYMFIDVYLPCVGTPRRQVIVVPRYFC
jgi:exonuclease III